MAEEKKLPKIGLNQLGPEELSKVAGGYGPDDEFMVFDEETEAIVGCPDCGSQWFFADQYSFFEYVECKKCGKRFYSVDDLKASDPYHSITRIF